MKVSFKFLNRWEQAIFDDFHETEFSPVGAFMAKSVLVASFVTLFIFFVLSAFFNGSEKDMIVAASIIFGIAFLVVTGKAFRNFRALPSIGMKAGYTAYFLVLFVICLCLLTYLAYAFLMIYLFWIFIKAMLGGSSKKSYSGSSDSKDHLYCAHCSRFPGRAGYCDMGSKYTNDYTTVGTCIYYAP